MFKKIFIILSILFINFSSSYASWSITGDGVNDTKTYWDWNYNWYIAECTNKIEIIGLHIPEGSLDMMYSINDKDSMDLACGENNPITKLTHETGQETTLEAGNIMTWPIWYIIYFTLWLSLLGVVIFTIKKFF